MWWSSSSDGPALTEKGLPSQEGRVFIVTGGYAGIGYELSKILYHLNGTVYVAGRSEDKARNAIQSIQQSSPAFRQSVPSGKGAVRFLHLDLGDLSSIQNSAQQFLAVESRLDIIWHNAGVMIPPDGSVTKQGLDLQLGTNALGPWLFQHYLTPLCLKTATLPGVRKNATRVILVTSNAHTGSPKPDGVNWDDINMHEQTGIKARLVKYGQSKAMNVMMAHEMARRYGGQGLISLSVHPGALATNLQRDLPWFLNAYFRWFRRHPRDGALTELFAGFSEGVDAMMIGQGGRNGGYVGPWGRFVSGAPHVFEGLGARETGKRLWGLCEEMCKPYM